MIKVDKINHEPSLFSFDAWLKIRSHVYWVFFVKENWDHNKSKLKFGENEIAQDSRI